MKKLLIVLSLFTIYSISAQEVPYSASKLWESGNLLTTSESVCYDSEEQVIYVSCINGNPVEMDGNGFISKVSLNGEIMLLNWVDQLNAPKGMGISRGKLYVSDINRVVQIDIKTANIENEFIINEAKFLNDITVDMEGNVYISDMASNNIYRIHENAIGLWLTSDKFQNPNGLNFENGELLVGTKDGIFSVDAESHRIWQLVKDTGGIDGLEILGNGYYIISDWQGKVQVVHPDKDPFTLFDTSSKGINAADIHYDQDRQILYVPTFMDNRVAAYQIIEN